MALVLTRRQARAMTSVGVRILIVSAVLSMAGCASYAQRYAQANEEGLKAAGFEKRRADTPEKLASLQAITQRKVLVYTWLGQPYYVWPDARFCRCFYIGSEPQYQEYARLGFEQKLAQERQTAAEENEAASLFAESWGPSWGPW